MLLTVRILKGLVEVLAMLYLAQAVILLFEGARRGNNFVFRLTKRLTVPFDGLTRRLAPRVLADRHLPLLSFLLLCLLWLGLVAAKIQLVFFPAAP